MFPPNGAYLKRIMQWCSYCNRDSILKLKDKGELLKMFKLVTDRQELIEDKSDMFGIFARNPSMVTILPGLESTFKRFLTKVENLVPKTTPESTVKQKTTKSTMRNEFSTTNVSEKKKKDEKTPPTAMDLVKRLTTWCCDKLVVLGRTDINKDDVHGSFCIVHKGDRKYEFTCQLKSCREVFVLAFSNNTVKMSNVQRHIQKCWLNNSEGKPIFTPLQSRATPSSNIFTSFQQSKKRVGESSSVDSKRTKNDEGVEERVTLHQDVDAYDHHMNRPPPPDDMIDFDSSGTTPTTVIGTATVTAPTTVIGTATVTAPTTLIGTATVTAPTMVIGTTTGTTPATETQTTLTASKNLLQPAGHQDLNGVSGL